MSYTFVNSILQMYTRSRAEGEATVSIANDPQTTNNPHGKKERKNGGRSQPAQTERSEEEGGRGDRRSPNGAQRSPRSDCPRLSESAEGATIRGETERSDRTPPRGERQRDEPPNDKHPAWLWGGCGGRKGQKARAEGERGNEATDRTERRRLAALPTARSDRAGRGAKARTEERGREEGERTERPRGRGSGRAFCPFLPPQGG